MTRDDDGDDDGPTGSEALFGIIKARPAQPLPPLRIVKPPPPEPEPERPPPLFVDRHVPPGGASLVPAPQSVMLRSMKERDQEIIRRWNVGDVTQAQLVAHMGLTIAIVNQVLVRARKLGVDVRRHERKGLVTPVVVVDERDPFAVPSIDQARHTPRKQWVRGVTYQGQIVRVMHAQGKTLREIADAVDTTEIAANQSLRRLRQLGLLAPGTQSVEGAPIPDLAPEPEVLPHHRSVDPATSFDAMNEGVGPVPINPLPEEPMYAPRIPAPPTIPNESPSMGETIDALITPATMLLSLTRRRVVLLRIVAAAESAAAELPKVEAAIKALEPLAETQYACKACETKWRFVRGEDGKLSLWSLWDAGQRPGPCCDHSPDFLALLTPEPPEECFAQAPRDAAKLPGAEELARGWARKLGIDG